MRLHVTLSENTQPVPFSYPHFLVGTFHKWHGQNDLHDSLSLYSLGWLQGGRKRGDHLTFTDGAHWFISAPDTEEGDELLSRIVAGAQKNPEVCCGMFVSKSEYNEHQNLAIDKPFVLIAPYSSEAPRTAEGLDPHLTYQDENADELLTHILRKKLIAAGLEAHAENATLRFDRNFKAPKTRLIKIQESSKRVNVCPVIGEGPPQALQFLWNVGAGHLTGCAFGSLI